MKNQIRRLRLILILALNSEICAKYVADHIKGHLALEAPTFDFSQLLN